MPKRKEAKGKVEEKAKSEELISLEDAASILGVSRSTFSRWLTEGRIKGKKVGRQWRFSRENLDKFGKMTHPSAARVNIAELEKVTAEITKGLPAEKKSIENFKTDNYPGTEEEVAINNLLSALMASALEATASDLHIEATRDHSVIRRRIDGVLHEVVELPRSIHKALVACVKIHAALDVNVSAPQDGRMEYMWSELDLDIRVSVIRAMYGEAVVMRFLVRSQLLATMDKLGMKADDQKTYENSLKKLQGMVILTGPNGSGKTTTMYAGLQMIAGPEKKTLTVEDPIEFPIPWSTQVPVSLRTGISFETGIRSFLRQDPDVIMVGAIRSLETAELCFHGALSGHMVLSSLFAKSTADAVKRLTDMGIEPFLIAEGIVCIVAQRLVRRICQNCAVLDKAALERVDYYAKRARAGGYELPVKPNFMRGAGCEQCHNYGYRGRIGLFEIMEITPDIAQLISEQASVEEIQQTAIANGMVTLKGDGLRKAAEGITPVVEVMRMLLGAGY